MTETRVEYAVRYEDPDFQTDSTYKLQQTAQRVADANSRPGCSASVVRRTVTYGEWEPVSD